MNRLREFLIDEQGADGIEYGIIISLIFLAIIVSVTLMAAKATAMWTNISSHVN